MLRLCLVSPKLQSHEGPKVLKVALGKPVRLDCDVTLGNPRAEIVWLHRNETLNEFHNQPTLDMNSSTVKDDGYYECVVSNEIGNTKQEFRVVILGEEH